MKILILVQSTDNPFYAPLIESQQKTWDAVEHPDITVLYYRPERPEVLWAIGQQFEGIKGRDLIIDHNKKSDNTFFVLMKALRYMLKKEQWDFVVKTDNSVYVNKELLYELLLTKPKEKYFGGFPITHENLSVESKKLYPTDIKFLWGEFMIMSRDCAVHLVTLFNKAPLKGVGAEDMILSFLLEEYCPWDESIRIATDESDSSNYAYRVRRMRLMFSPIFEIPANMKEVIDSDITIMNKIHNLITNGQTDNHSILPEQVQN